MFLVIEKGVYRTIFNRSSNSSIGEKSFMIHPFESLRYSTPYVFTLSRGEMPEILRTRDTQNELFGDLKRLQLGLEILHEAYCYAAELGRDVWEFAVEIDTLHDVGLSDNHLRWLVDNQLLEHAREVTIVTESERQFRRSLNLVFSRITCFVLTPIGERWVYELGRIRVS